MRIIFFNTHQEIRIIWRFLTFVLVTLLINVPLQWGMREILDKSVLRSIVSGTVFILSILASLRIQTQYLEHSSFAKYGIAVDARWIREFALGCFIAVIQLCIFFLLMYYSGNLEVVDYFIINDTDFTFWGGFAVTVMQQVVAGVGEEIIFRSFLFFMVFESLQKLSKNHVRSAILAGVSTSLFFGFAHYSNDGATLFSTINLCLDGMLICLPFLISGRLGMSIGMHFAWNVMQGAILGFANSGTIAKASLLSSVMPDNIWTGGAFGPEGSVLLMLLDAIALGLIVIWMKYQNYEKWVHPRFEGSANQSIT